jgi:hypothetical protein
VASDSTLIADPTFRAFAVTVAPSMSGLDEAGWAAVGATIEHALARRPLRMRRQLGLLLRVIGGLPRARYGRGFAALDADRRAAFIAALERSRIKLVRRGVWGLRTLVLMGYYTRPRTMAEVGYRADARGWAARREQDAR